MFIELKERVKHYCWRRVVRRERRRRLRQAKARERDKKLQEEQDALLSDPAYLEELEEYQRLEELAQKQEEEEAARRKEEWQLRDAALHSKFLREKEKLQLQEEARQKQEELIRSEWENKQKKEKEEADKKNEAQKALLEAATEGLGKDTDEPTHNPEPPANYQGRELPHTQREACPFFTKTGACRFGIHCSREHSYPEVSETILIPNMYSHFGMEKVAFDEYNDDASLEYSERETYEHFRDFYEDTLPEFKRFGSVIQFKVCCNASVHLRGNLYVQYSCEAEAVQARSVFNGRWYAGRQLNCIFVNISKWKAALCRLFQRNRKGCPKGGQCNFLHAFYNPGSAFWRADLDLPLVGPVENPHASSHRKSDRRGREESSRRKDKYRRSRSRSRSKSRSVRSSSRRSRSRSSERSSYRSCSSSNRLKVKSTSHDDDSQKSRSHKNSRLIKSTKRRRSRSKSPINTGNKVISPDRKSGVSHHKSKSVTPKRDSRYDSDSRSPKRTRNKSRSPKRSEHSKSKSSYRSDKLNGSHSGKDEKR